MYCTWLSPRIMFLSRIINYSIYCFRVYSIQMKASGGAAASVTSLFGRHNIDGVPLSLSPSGIQKSC